MRKFIRKTLWLTFLVLIVFTAITLLCFSFVLPQYSQTYQASLIDKVERLQSIDEPKIVLIGNSNLAFGIDSKMISEAFDMPVVNMGLHGGMGNVFHEEMTRLNVNSGDIYILCHTDYDDDDKINDTKLAWITVENNWELWDLLRVKDIISMLKTLPNYMLDSWVLFTRFEGNRIEDACYTRLAFNEYGDNVYERSESRYNFAEKNLDVPKINEVCTSRINELNTYLQREGAVLLICAFPIADGDYSANATEYIEFQEDLAKEIDCDIISDFKDYMYDYDLFYDTRYHLNDSGIKMHTQHIIDDLLIWMQE